MITLFLATEFVDLTGFYIWITVFLKKEKIKVTEITLEATDQLEHSDYEWESTVGLKELLSYSIRIHRHNYQNWL